MIQDGPQSRIVSLFFCSWPSCSLSLIFRFSRIGTLLAPDPPPERIAQAKEQNDQLAKQAYPNLMRVAGSSESSSSSDSDPKKRHLSHEHGLMRVNGGSASVSNRESPADKRAAMPQGSFKAHPVHLRAGQHSPRSASSDGDHKQFDESDDKGRAAAAGAGTRGFKRVDEGSKVKAGHLKSRDVIGGFDYGVEPVRGVNLGGWLVCKSDCDVRVPLCYLDPMLIPLCHSSNLL